MAEPAVHRSIRVSSGGLCYGAVHNISHGASVDIQGFPGTRPEQSGTVRVHRTEHNVAALNGIWNAYQLVDKRSRDLVGWMLTHDSTFVREEIGRILRVAGSPYEEESGSSMNDDSTAAAGVFVINRYDWGHYDERSLGNVGQDTYVSDQKGYDHASIGIVDHATARDAVQRWNQQPVSSREWGEGSAWLTCRGEYMFGRIGFTSEKTAACSFLFFTEATEFLHTRLADSAVPLRKLETAEERFQRRLGEGHDFSGLDKLKRFGSPPEVLHGPYDATQHILSDADIEAARNFPSVARLPRKAVDLGYKHRHFRPFARELLPAMVDLINEMFLSWLEGHIIRHSPAVSPEVYFPKHQDAAHIDQEALRCFRKIGQEPVAKVDAAGVSARIGDFLRSRSWTASEETAAGLYRVVEYLLLELIELASDQAGDLAPGTITTGHIRLGVGEDDQLLEMLGSSAVYWNGRIQELS